MGRYLELAKRAIAKARQAEAGIRTPPAASKRIKQSSPIPRGSVLLAPRFDGDGKPLKAIPKCWCCRTPYQLERLQDWRGKTYAWLEPGCGCLDVRTCYRCFVCGNHCRCTETSSKQDTRRE
jgi:hypothetical protein